MTDEKRKATEWHLTVLSSLAKNIEKKDTNTVYYRGYETVNVLNEVCDVLQQPDKTVDKKEFDLLHDYASNNVTELEMNRDYMVEVLKGVREMLHDSFWTDTNPIDGGQKLLSEITVGKNIAHAIIALDALIEGK